MLHRRCLVVAFFTLLLAIGNAKIIADDSKSQSLTGPSWDFSHGELRVSDDHRFLIHQDGTPFLYLGDTAWELFHRLDRDEVEFYLDKRRSQGYTVIQAVALAEFGCFRVPNPYGHFPLIDQDPTKPNVKDGPNNDYWDHVDDVVQIAEKKGIYIGFLPTWGDKVTKAWGEGPEIFNEKNAEIYGEFLGKRFGKHSNIIWILGGDRLADDREKIWDAMARGIKRGEEKKHLITFHPQGWASSSRWFQNVDWLDFNTLQSSHGSKNLANYELITRDYNLIPVKPCMDSEPRYENHPCRDDSGVWFDDFDVRQAAYWALFAGAFGHTYGCHDIWSFYDGTNERRLADQRTPWKESVDLPGAWDMLHVRQLLLSRPFLGRVPQQSLIVDGPEKGMEHVQATLGKDGSYALVYIPAGNPVTIDLGKLSGKKIAVSWFDPKTGKSHSDGTVEKSVKQKQFTPPGKVERGNDWVLVLDDVSRNYPLPGKGK